MAKKKSKQPSSTAPGMFYGALSILVPAVVWGLVIFVVESESMLKALAFGVGPLAALLLGGLAIKAWASGRAAVRKSGGEAGVIGLLLGIVGVLLAAAQWYFARHVSGF